jgi:hypothetical protein
LEEFDANPNAVVYLAAFFESHRMAENKNNEKI